MAPLVSTIEIARPPGDVFAFATDPERFSEWQRDVTSARMLDSARFATTRRIAGSERTQVQVITHSEPPNSWGARGIEGPIRASATISIDAAGDGTTSRVTFTLDFKGHGIGKALLPLVRRQAEKVAPISYRNLKMLLEA